MPNAILSIYIAVDDAHVAATVLATDCAYSNQANINHEYLSWLELWSNVSSCHNVMSRKLGLEILL